MNKKTRFVFLFLRDDIPFNEIFFNRILTYQRGRDVPRHKRFSMDLFPTIFKGIFASVEKGDVEMVALLHPNSLSWVGPLKSFAASYCPELYSSSDEYFCQKFNNKHCPFFHQGKLYYRSCEILKHIRFIDYDEFIFKEGDRFYKVFLDLDEEGRRVYSPGLWICDFSCHLL